MIATLLISCLLSLAALPTEPGQRTELVHERDSNGKFRKLLTEEVEAKTGALLHTLITYSHHGALRTTSIWRNNVPYYHSRIFTGVNQRTFHVYSDPDPAKATAEPPDSAKYRPHLAPALFLKKEITQDTDDGRKISQYRRTAAGKFTLVRDVVSAWQAAH